MSNFDVIVIGAGSIGVPAAMTLALHKKKVLCLDSLPSPGQANNKKAIGGVRATHSDFGKIKVCQRSIEIFSTWKEVHGDDIGWITNGYSFVAYNDVIERQLKETLHIRQDFGLNIKWLTADEFEKLAPGIERNELRGAIYSPEDGSCSPMMACNAFYFKSIEFGAEYRFNEDVVDVKFGDSQFMVKTNKGNYRSKYLINASGNNAKAISGFLGYECPVVPDSHEAAITEPVQRFFEPMIVDLRASNGASNYYFYQNNEGQVIFCITPDPLIIGYDSDATSEFLPLCITKILKIYPRLKNLKVRRQWRGQYPMTPDGLPIVGSMKDNDKFIQAVGMCGQGFMLGPGLGELLNRMVDGALTEEDELTLKSFDPYRDFDGVEKFK
jgi:sarcosine oxidase subunit beta